MKIIFILSQNEFENKSKLSFSRDKLINQNLKISLARRNKIDPMAKEHNNTRDDHPGVPNDSIIFRDTRKPLKGLFRLYHFVNSPLVKYINHFVSST